MGSFLLAGGTITKRMAFPHARVMMHQPSTSFLPDSESTRDFYMEIDELAQYRATNSSKLMYKEQVCRSGL